MVYCCAVWHHTHHKDARDAQSNPEPSAINIYEYYTTTVIEHLTSAKLWWGLVVVEVLYVMVQNHGW